MPITASRLFDFLNDLQACYIERYVISSQLFSILRHHVRSLVIGFRESDEHEAQDIADRLRSVLSEWLTVPVPFNKSMDHALEALGDPASVERRWGRDIRNNLEQARLFANELQTIENPLRGKLRDVLLEEVIDGGFAFKIYCHRRAQMYFESLLNDAEVVSLPPNLFLHSVAEYRESDLFDVLIKVGPLRSRGWGAAPDALITAPRFDTLIQILWSGCQDESDFGYDPISTTFLGTGEETTEQNIRNDPSAHGIVWKIQQIDIGDSKDKYDFARDMDDLQIFRELHERREMQEATLIQVDVDHGILFPPSASVLSFDVTVPETIGYRLPSEMGTDGTLIILPVLYDAALTGIHAEEGYYSKIWKQKLATELSNNRENLITSLRSEGIELVHLASRIEHWCKPATTVIHAPQQIQHFKALVKVLGLDSDNIAERKKSVLWWQYGWDEIRRARGEAIQSGFQEQNTVDRKFLSFLRSIETEIYLRAETENTFQIPIKDCEGLSGYFRFFKVMSVEGGFTVPTVNLRMILELDLVDQWRK